MPASDSTTSRSLVALLVASLGFAVGADAQDTIEWARPIDGDFALATHWFPSVVPTELDTAELGGLGSYAVSLDSRVLGTVDLANPAATLRLAPGQDATVTRLTGPGEFVVSDGVTRGNSILRVRSGGVLDSRVRLDGFWTSDASVFSVGGPGTLGPDAHVSGHGRFVGTWDGPGLFHANAPGTLILNGAYTGVTLRASNGGTLDIHLATFEEATIEATRTGSFGTGATTRISRSTVQGPFRVEWGALTLGPDVVFEDGLAIGTGTGFGEGNVIVAPGATLDAAVRLDGGALTGLFGAIIGPGAVISGGHVSGSGVAGPYGVLGTWNSDGIIAMDIPGMLEVSATITGGTLRASGGGTIDIPQAELRNVTIVVGDGGQYSSSLDTRLADSVILGDYRILPGDGLALGKNVTIEDRVVASEAARVGLVDSATLTGHVHMEASPSTATLLALETPATIGPTARISGTGRFAGEFTVEGKLAPGVEEPGGVPSDLAVGTFDLAGGVHLTLTPDARLEIDIAGADRTRFDHITGLVHGGRVTLGGVLDVRFVDDYEPAVDDRYEILGLRGIDGAFDSIDVPAEGAVAAVGPAHVVYNWDSVVLVVCAGDRDGDGELTMFDFLAYQNQFAAGDEQADLDQDGRLTLFDFLLFQNRFDAGCG